MTHTTYVTKDEFDRSPVHAIDSSTLVPGGTSTENETALTEILEAATAMVNAEVGRDTLAATTSTETIEARLNRNLEITVRPAFRPINSVSSVRYRTRGSATWTTVESTYIEADEYKVSVIANTVPTIDGQAIAGASSYLHPSDVDRLTKIPLMVELTYNHGYATIPQDVKTATILFAASLIKQRGSVAVEMDGSPSIMGGNPYAQGDIDKAKALLRRYK